MPGSRIDSKGGRVLAQEIEKAEGIRNNAGKRWPTPRAQERQQYNSRDKYVALSKAVQLPTPTANRRSGLQSHGCNVVSGQLNPTWVEWLMGFPLGWTDLDVSETP